MTLALILLLSISCTAPRSLATAQAAGQTTPQAAPDRKPAITPESPNQGTQAQSPVSPSKPESSSSAGQTPSAQKPAAVKRLRHKKKLIPANCDSAPAAGTGSTTAGTGTPSTAPADPVAGASAPAPKTQSAPTHCPPSKIIVRQGGTSEPSIQLEGGAVGDQAASQRDKANQMLGATEANLKKLVGLQLTQNQQDMVSQVRQFMQQSRTAVAAGDLERARTLAWKAELLSEELVKPGK